MNNTRIVVTYTALSLAALLVVSVLHWPTRWRIIAYLPFLLISIHAVIYLLWASTKNEKYRSLYLGYFLVPLVVHIVYAIMAIGAFFKASPLAGGPIFLLAVPLAPFLSAPFVEQRIEHEKEKLYAESIEFGLNAHNSILPSSGALPEKVATALFRKFQKNPDEFSGSFLNDWVQHYTAERYPPGYPAFESVLMHPAITAESLLKFAKNQKENDNAEFISKNPNAPIEAILVCAESENTLVQLAAAESGRLGPERSEAILWDMIENDKHAWRARISRSSVATPEMLDRILDQGLDRSSFVVHHPSVASKQLSRLSEHEISWVRRAVAAHPKTNQQTLEKSRKDPVPEVADAALSRLNQSEENGK